jgi:transketolase
MRRTFINALAEAARRDPRIVLLTADLGWGVLSGFDGCFADEFPSQFLNVGVAEQNMIGVATGLAKNGYIPFCWSISPFAVLRPLEFILRGPILHNVPVRIVCTGRGEEYKDAGPTHWADEAEDVIKTLVKRHGVHWHTPHSADSVRACVNDLVDTAFYTGPAFVSLSKGGCK